ncbi:hypothetical protein WS81_18435 [Burkholderia sp. MSMB2040]|nr:hypothetical protein WS81_18435 [Burkholderia sp. MSMB2040]KWZ47807.1 hypothetical protein WS73_04450 [Burkholderia savannae]
MLRRALTMGKPAVRAGLRERRRATSHTIECSGSARIPDGRARPRIRDGRSKAFSGDWSIVGASGVAEAPGHERHDATDSARPSAAGGTAECRLAAPVERVRGEAGARPRI